MKSMYLKALIAAVVISFAASAALAAKHDAMEGHGNMDHGSMNQSSDHSTEMDHSKMGHSMEGHEAKVMGVGVIHRVSKLNRMVNLTHEPIPALKWPEMTMDLPVAESVNLAELQAGDKVKFHLGLGADKKYIITEIMK